VFQHLSEEADDPLRAVLEGAQRYVSLQPAFYMLETLAKLKTDRLNPEQCCVNNKHLVDNTYS